MVRKTLIVAVGIVATNAFAQKPPPAPMFTRAVEACVIPAAQYHKVNHNILWAILKVESNFRPATVAKNTNGTSDYGMGGMNTIHMPKLAKFGITPTNISDPCISTYVTAWHLSKEMARYGNNWYGIAAYHSATPYFNNRYQILLKNALIDAGVLQGQKQAVPALRPTAVNNPTSAKPANNSNTTVASNAHNSPMTVLQE